MAYQNINLTTLQTLVRARLASPTFWTNSEITAAINDALRTYGLASGRWKDRFVINTVANRVIYNINQLAAFQSPSNVTKILAPMRIVYQGLGQTPQPLAWTSWSDLDCSVPGWQFQTTQSAGAPPTPTACGLFGGVNFVFIWPADAAGANSLQFDCLLTAPVLVNGTDFVNLDTGDIIAVVGMATHLCSWKRGGIYFQETMPLYEQFLRVCAERNGYLKAISPFKEALGDSSDRRTRPRRVSEMTGQRYGIGVR